MYSKLFGTQLIFACGVVFLLICWQSLPIEATIRKLPLEDNPEFRERLDFVVIGGVPDGSILAKRLSENPEWNILVLEPKKKKSSSYHLRITTRKKCRWPYQDRQPKIYVRGVAEDYERWLQEGNHGWGWDDVLPYFEKSVAETRSADTLETYMVLKEPKLFNKDFEEAERIFLFRNSKSVRLNHTAQKGFYDLAYTEVKNNDAINKRPNLFVINNAEPKRINFDTSGKWVKSVSFIYKNRTMEVSFKKELVLSAGAIDSAKLLMLSGVGIKKDLNSLNIPVVHDVPVGKNLRDHITLPLFFVIPFLDVIPLEEQSNNSTNGKRGPFEDRGMLPLTEFANTVRENENGVPDIEYHHYFIKHHDFATLSNWKKMVGRHCKLYYNLEKLLLSNNLLIIQAVLANPLSRGSVKLRKSGNTYKPKISGNYLDKAKDEEMLLRSIIYLEAKAKTEGFGAPKLVRISNPECNMRKLDNLYWRCYIKFMAMPQFDPVGTVKMGTNRNGSCVNSRLLIHGVKNLRVADASIMPDIPSSEITAATMMIAEKAADLIKEDWMAKK